jgi:hypothetical protein
MCYKTKHAGSMCDVYRTMIVLASSAKLQFGDVATLKVLHHPTRIEDGDTMTHGYIPDGARTG